MSTSVLRVGARLRWPDGTYALPRTEDIAKLPLVPGNVVGCPFMLTVRFNWSLGWVQQDTENESNMYSNSESRNLFGQFSPDHIMTQFCTKTSSSSDSGRQWPEGSYCIVKYGSCPSGFKEGSIFWDDQNEENRNTCGGDGLPDGSFGTDTRIDYCCRNDAPPSAPIKLPYMAPFYLMQQSSGGCQKVKRMTVTEEYLQWDDENDGNKDSESGLHPYDDGDGQNHRLHYCLYQPKPKWAIKIGSPF